MEREIYLDNSATTRVFPEAAELMHRIYTEDYGNPSSMHRKGVEAERQILRAKEILAGILKVQPKNLYFTSCGSESDNLALIGCARANQRKGRHLITTVIEHPGVMETMHYLESEGYEVTYLPVDKDGLVSPEDVEAAMREDTILVSVMHTNNEIGALEPVAEIGERIKKKDPAVLFHVDAVQGFGKAVIRPKKMHIDLLAVSGHKIHGPKGIGFLYVADGVKIKNIIYGGGQQNGLRSGTENVAGIAAMALSAQMLYDHFDEDTERLYGMKESFLREIAGIPDVQVNGRTGRDSAPHIISLSFKNVRAEVLLHALEEKKIYVSSGSACSTHHTSEKGIIDRIGGNPEYRDGTIRISMSVLNTPEDMQAAAAALKEIVPFLRRYTRN